MDVKYEANCMPNLIEHVEKHRDRVECECEQILTRESKRESWKTQKKGAHTHVNGFTHDWAGVKKIIDKLIVSYGEKCEYIYSEWNE